MSYFFPTRYTAVNCHCVVPGGSISFSKSTFATKEAKVVRDVGERRVCLVCFEDCL